MVEYASKLTIPQIATTLSSTVEREAQGETAASTTTAGAGYTCPDCRARLTTPGS